MGIRIQILFACIGFLFSGCSEEFPGNSRYTIDSDHSTNNGIPPDSNSSCGDETSDQSEDRIPNNVKLSLQENSWKKSENSLHQKAGKKAISEETKSANDYNDIS